MANRVPITIRLESFEGPLDLLLYLIQSHEMNISRISIGKITDQYLAYVQLMQELNFDVASDFLVMAATLIQWKSKSLLPQEIDPALAGAAAEEEMTQDELLRQLMEHQRFLDAGKEIAALTVLGEDVFRRPNLKSPVSRIWKEMAVTDLALTYQDLLVRERKRTTILKKETVSLADKIVDFADKLEVGKIISMNSLLREIQHRPEVVVTFLASLELARLRKMRLYQEGTYQEIYVELLESISDFNAQLATGFDAVEASINESIYQAQEKKIRDDEITATQAGVDAAARALEGLGIEPQAFDLAASGEVREPSFAELLSGSEDGPSPDAEGGNRSDENGERRRVPAPDDDSESSHRNS